MAGPKTDEKPTPPPVRKYRALNTSQEEMALMVKTIRDNLKGQNISARDLKKITVPAQGVTKWIVSNPDGSDEYLDEIEGIVVLLETPRAYWSTPLDLSRRTPPDCSSTDGIRGVGDPGGECAPCPFNQWGSSQTGRKTGKACKEQRLMYTLLPGDIMPTIVQGPVTSIESLKKYLMELSIGSEGTRNYKHVYTQMTLEKVDGEFTYSRIHFTPVGDVDDEDKPKLDHYVEAMTQIIGQSTYLPEPIEILMAEEAAGLPAASTNGTEAQAPPVTPDAVVDQMLTDPVNEGVDGAQSGETEAKTPDVPNAAPAQGQLVTDPDADPDADPNKKPKS